MSKLIELSLTKFLKLFFLSFSLRSISVSTKSLFAVSSKLLDASLIKIFRLFSFRGNS